MDFPRSMTLKQYAHVCICDPNFVFRHRFSLDTSVMIHCSERYPGAPDFDDFDSNWNIIYGYEDAYESFINSGVLISSNLELSLLPCQKTFRT